MRFNPEASWGANAGLDVPRKALEDVKVCLSSAWDDLLGFHHVIVIYHQR